MSKRRTWAELKNLIGLPVGLSSCNPNLIKLANEGIELLWSMGDWVGKNQRYKIRLTCDARRTRTITWPHAAETIEAINICDQPIGIRNQYFEFQNNVRGSIARNRGRNCIPLVGDRTEVVTHDDIQGEPKRLRIYTERIEPTGRILLLGYDVHGNWIRTQPIAGQWTDGEYLDLANSPATTLSYFAQVTGVQFDKTPRNGATYLYAVDNSNNQFQLATYDYATATPVFRRSVISYTPRGFSGANDWNGECVTALIKTRFLPVIFDTDYPQISNIAAMKAVLQYIYKRDNDKIQDAGAYLQEAERLLNEELKQFNGYGAKKTINFGPKQVTGTARNLM